MIGVFMFGYIAGLVTSACVSYIVWPIYVASVRKRGETWAEAKDRELSRLDRLAEREEIPETVRSYTNDRSVN